jgi:hypothetical protein
VDARHTAGHDERVDCHTARRLDCFVAAAPRMMSQLGQASAFSRREAPERCTILIAFENRGRRESRVPAAPAASRAKYKKHTSLVTTGSPETPGLPCAMVLRLISRSPRGPGFLAPVASRIASRNLTPASGRQDHTTSPSAR